MSIQGNTAKSLALILALQTPLGAVNQVPNGVSKIPDIEFAHTEQAKVVRDLAVESKGRQAKAVVKITAENGKFKGGFRQSGKVRVSLVSADSVGFWLYDMASLLQAVSSIIDGFYAHHVAYIINYDYSAFAIINQIIQQGETTARAQKRTTEEAANCCYAVTESCKKTLAQLEKELENWTYKTTDSAPRKTLTKRTRL